MKCKALEKFKIMKNLNNVKSEVGEIKAVFNLALNKVKLELGDEF